MKPRATRRTSTTLGKLIYLSFFVGTLTSVSASAHSQSLSVRDLQVTDLWNIGKLKQTSEFSEELVNNIEGFRPSNLNILPGRLRKVTIDRSMERAGQSIGQETHVIESLSDWPGYYGVSKPQSNDEQRTISREVNFLNLSIIASKRKFRSQRTYLFTGTSTTEYTRFIAESKLPRNFEAAMEPGTTWSYEQTYETESATTSAIGDKKRGDISFRSTSCTNGKTIPANSVHTALSGNALPIRCLVNDGEVEDVHDFTYLRDYGFFLPILSELTPRKSGSGKIVVRYVIKQIEAQ